MERKTRRTYENVFDVLKAETRRRVRRDLEPVKISTDYEQSAIQAVRASFPGEHITVKCKKMSPKSYAEVAGCLFHFGQA
ncbi:hypothetical protein FOCC_FOCC011152 [Frankliniella occidentalis]|nr:hypothetical protein FOCC_FOCC011152 [Frankliniella occidentalis]